MNSTRYPSLQGKSVFVTGGASGIGAAIVDAFVRQGALVAFADVDRDAAEKLLARVAALGPDCVFEYCDLRQTEDLQKALARAAGRQGPIEILINNAARDDRHKIADLTPAAWDENLAINLKPMFFAAQAVLPAMTARAAGVILNLGSITARLGMAGLPAYVAAKGGVEGLTKALAREAGAAGIRVNCIVPGWIVTERQKKLWLTAEAAAEWLPQQAIREWVQPEDVASLALFLASDDARMITGQSIVIDAGRT